MIPVENLKLMWDTGKGINMDQEIHHQFQYWVIVGKDDLLEKKGIGTVQRDPQRIPVSFHNLSVSPFDTDDTVLTGPSSVSAFSSLDTRPARLTSVCF